MRTVLVMGNTERLAATLATFGWPPIMRMEIACRYTVRSRWTLQRAVQAGELVPAGRNKRSLTFRREDLDRWLLGSANDNEGSAQPSPVRTRQASNTSDALERLAAIRRGDR